MNLDFWKSNIELLTKTVIKLKQILLITFITLLIGGGICSLLVDNISTTAIILYWLVTILLIPGILVTYKILVIKLIMFPIIEKYKSDHIINIENLIKDLALIKTLDTMNLSDIRDNQTENLIDEILESITTEEGKLLKNQLLKSKNYIKYEHNFRTSEKD